MRDTWVSFVGIVSLLIGLAIISVIVSKRSQTSTLINSFSTALDTLLKASTGKT